MHTLAKHWWVLLLRGIVAILFGLLTFAAPGITLAYLITLFAVFAIFDGVLNLIGAFRAGTGHWWAMALMGVFGIIAGVLTFMYPGMTALLLLYYIAFWSIFSGIAEIIAAIRLRKEIEGEWLLILAGVVSVLFGMFLIGNPGAGALGVVLYIGIYALVAGVVLLILAFRLRGAGEKYIPRTA